MCLGNFIDTYANALTNIVVHRLHSLHTITIDYKKENSRYDALSIDDKYAASEKPFAYVSSVNKAYPFRLAFDGVSEPIKLLTIDAQRKKIP